MFPPQCFCEVGIMPPCLQEALHHVVKGYYCKMCIPISVAVVNACWTTMLSYYQYMVSEFLFWLLSSAMYRCFKWDWWCSVCYQWPAVVNWTITLVSARPLMSKCITLNVRTLNRHLKPNTVSFTQKRSWHGEYFGLDKGCARLKILLLVC